MAKYLAGRIIFRLFTLLAMSVIVFAITEITPGNIAYNNLGNMITPQQEASFNAQYGLDDPPLTRYRRWLLGSDRQAERLMGRPIQRIRNDVGRLEWWAVADDGTLFKSYVEDGEQIMRRQRQDDGTVIFLQHPNDQWQIDENGDEIFWGINLENRGTQWVRGGTAAGLSYSNSQWITSPNAPHDYLPIQKGLLRGDPGLSMSLNRPVAEVLGYRLQNSMILAGISFVLIMPISLLFGLMAGLSEGSWGDRILSFIGIAASMTPQFVSGIFLVVIFSAWLGWLPAVVIVDSGENLLSKPKMLILPILTLTMAELGYILRITRASVVDIMGENYIRTAILKGLPWKRVVLKHIVPNAMLAPLTVMMLHVNYLIGGLVIVEQIFGFPGIGRYLLEAAFAKDVFAIEAGAMVLLVIATCTQVVADFLYTFLNPRIRFQ